MKNSKRNLYNEAVKRHERRQGLPAVSKYAAKCRPQIEAVTKGVDWDEAEIRLAQRLGTAIRLAQGLGTAK